MLIGHSSFSKEIKGNTDIAFGWNCTSQHVFKCISAVAQPTIELILLKYILSQVYQAGEAELQGRGAYYVTLCRFKTVDE